MRLFSIFIVLACLKSACLAATDAPIFSFHLSSEPGSLDPAQSGAQGNYLLRNLFRGLYIYTANGELKPDEAENCVWLGSLRLKCSLKEKLFWSNGDPIEAKDYVFAFNRFFSKDVKSRAHLHLSNLEGYSASLQSAGTIPLLGLKANSARTLEFSFAHDDPEFIFKLASLPMVPAHKNAMYGKTEITKFIGNGPYQVERWQKNKIFLQPNPHFKDGKALDRPKVSALVVDDDQTAYDLFQKGQLSYLRRLPTQFIPEWRGKKEFYQVPMQRFDYLGFGSDLEKWPQARKAFSLSLNFIEHQKLFSALGRIGCPSLSEKLLDRVPCLSFDAKAASAAWQKLDKEVQNKSWVYKFSQLGGEDHRRTAEWMQQQWKKNLGVQVEIQAVDNAMFTAELKSKPPLLFRRGIGMERPTCLAALEAFDPDSEENFIHLKDPRFKQWLERLGQPDLGQGTRRRLCRQAIESLLKDYRLIPQGRIHFSILASSQFKGWELNELNELDLASLRYSDFKTIKSQ